MEDVIAQFIKLPVHIRTAVSSPDAIARLEKIEQRYNVQLANLVMRVATKRLPISNLETELTVSSKVTPEVAKEIRKDLVYNIFSQIANYLGFRPDATPDASYALSRAHEASLGVMERDAEIEKHASTLKYQPKEELYDVEALAMRLAGQFQLQFDHVLAKRFEKLLESRLVDARTKEDFQDKLARPTKIGGLALDTAKAAALAKIAEEEHEKIHALHLKVKMEKQDQRPITSPKPHVISMHPSHPPLQAERLPQPKKPVAPPKPLEIKKPEPQKPQIPEPGPRPSLQPKQGATAFIPPAKPPIAPSAIPPQIKKPIPSTVPAQPVIAQPQFSMPEVEPRKHAAVPQFMPRVLRERQEPTRPTVSDITAPSKLVGPVEELRTMTIQDFRRLGETMQESISRVREMIRNLEHESFERRSEGVKAWRSSALMKEYLSIGQESMEKNTDVNRIISERQVKGGHGISSEEFEAIGSLNRLLRY